MSAPARVKWLAAPSSFAWLEQAIAQPELVLIDHAHCERKAAGVALQLMFRYQSDEELAGALSPLAREELEHFEQVLQVLQARGQALRPWRRRPMGPAWPSRCAATNPSAGSIPSWVPA